MHELLHLELTRHVQQDGRSGDIGFNHWSRLINAAVHVGFGGKMNDGVAALHDRLDRRSAADISFDKGVFRMFRNVCKIRQVSRIG